MGKLRDGDPIVISIDTTALIGTVDALVDEAVLADRPTHPGLLAREFDLPDDTRLWAALQARSGGCWGGCVYDADLIVTALE